MFCLLTIWFPHVGYAWLRWFSQVVEPRNLSQANGVQVPNNDCIPLLQSTAPLLPTAFKLELLRCSNIVLAVNDHELIVLDLIPVLRLRPQEVSLRIHQGEADLLALIDVPHLPSRSLQFPLPFSGLCTCPLQSCIAQCPP
jgi:hypothetical protein